jgi:predicted Zn-dependent protease
MARSSLSRAARVHRAAWLAGTLLGAPLAGCGGPAQSAATETVVSDPLSTADATDLYQRGTALAQAQDYVRAEQYFVSAMQRGYPEEQLMAPLLSACIRSSRLSAALTYAEPFLERHPEAWSLRLLVATIHMGLGDAGRAHEQLVQVARDRPDEPSVHYMLGVLSRDELRDSGASREAFQRYLELEPRGPHAEEARAALVRAQADGAPRPARMPSHASERPPTEESP